jgi:hypothetical protein
LFLSSRELGLNIEESLVRNMVRVLDRVIYIAKGENSLYFRGLPSKEKNYMALEELYQDVKSGLEETPEFRSTRFRLLLHEVELTGSLSENFNGVIRRHNRTVNILDSLITK